MARTRFSLSLDKQPAKHFLALKAKRQKREFLVASHQSSFPLWTFWFDSFQQGNSVKLSIQITCSAFCFTSHTFFFWLWNCFVVCSKINFLHVLAMLSNFTGSGKRKANMEFMEFKFTLAFEWFIRSADLKYEWTCFTVAPENGFCNHLN